MIQLTISACCDCGLTREKNEDMVLVGDALVRDDVYETSLTLHPDSRCALVVCDGVGGRNAGEVASQDAAEQFAQAFASFPKSLDSESLQKEIEGWHAAEHKRLNEMSADNSQYEGMGTTMVGLFFYEGHVLWGNCGDSRLYRYRDGILLQLSVDHSLYNITRRPEDIHIITNSLGAGVEIPSYIDTKDISSQVLDGDIFLLCSDGLYDRVPDDELEHLLNGGADAAMMVMAACEFGTQDNVSAIIVKVETTDKE